MKRRHLSLASLCTLMLCSNSANANTLEFKLHAGGSALMTTLAAPVCDYRLRHTRVNLPHWFNTSHCSAIASGLVGVLKEAIDSTTEGNRFSGQDIRYNLLGIGVGLLTIQLGGGLIRLNTSNDTTTISYSSEVGSK